MLVLESAVRQLSCLGIDSDEIAFYKSFGCYLQKREDNSLPLNEIKQDELSDLAWFHQINQLIQDESRFNLPEVRVYRDAGGSASQYMLNAAAIAVYNHIQTMHYLLQRYITHSYVSAYVDKEGHFNVEPSGFSIFQDPVLGSRRHTSILPLNLALGLGPSELDCLYSQQAGFGGRVQRYMVQVNANEPSVDSYSHFMQYVSAVLYAGLMSDDSLSHSAFPKARSERVVKDGETYLARYVQQGDRVIPFMQVNFLPNRQMDTSISNLMRITMAFTQYSNIISENKGLFYLFGEGAHRDESQMLAVLLRCLADTKMCDDVTVFLKLKTEDQTPERLQVMLDALVKNIIIHLEEISQYQLLELSKDQLSQLLEVVIYSQAIRVFKGLVQDQATMSILINDLRRRLYTVDLPELVTLDIAPDELDLTDDVDMMTAAESAAALKALVDKADTEIEVSNDIDMHTVGGDATPQAPSDEERYLADEEIHAMLQELESGVTTGDLFISALEVERFHALEVEWQQVCSTALPAATASSASLFSRFASSGHHSPLSHSDVSDSSGEERVFSTK